MTAQDVSYTPALMTTEGDSPYTLRSIINDIPLAADPSEDNDVYITSADVWKDNLYIGTSAAELLHFVSIPAEHEGQEPTWILASRLQAPFNTAQDGADKGVKQILLLPAVAKACVLCNGTLTFYSLPELSPAFGREIRQAGCSWVGGLDLSASQDDGGNGGTTIVLCLRQRLRLIKIGDDARKIGDIELGGVSAIQRRGDLACVADGNSYSLLDVVNQRKNDLFPIASTAEARLPQATQVLAPPTSHKQGSRSFSSTSPVRVNRGHERNVSLGSAPKGGDRLRPDSGSWPARGSSRGSSPGHSPSRGENTVPVQEASDNSTPPPPPAKDSPPQALPPRIVSPSPTEFLLTTGTKLDDPSVGMFVNLEGDVVRGTIEFSTYPDALVLDQNEDQHTPEAEVGKAGYVLALVRRKVDGEWRSVIEIQQWEADPGEVQRERHYLPVPHDTAAIDDHAPLLGVGLRTVTTTTELEVPEVSKTLRQRRLRLADSDTNEFGANELKRNGEEDAFAARFSKVSVRTVVFTGSQAFWAVRSNTAVRLNTTLNRAVVEDESGSISIDGSKVQYVLNSIRGQEASNELDFLTLTYIRQKGSLLLFGHLLLQTAAGFIAYERDKRAASQALEEGDLDPRVLLLLVPPFPQEVKEGDNGIWIPQGLVDTVALLRDAIGTQIEAAQDPKGPYGDNLLQPLKRYLLFWRKKKGFGSVADEAHVFYSVDAALLHVLLLLDQYNPRGPANGSSVRAELNEVVDKGVQCFDRAVSLFEQFHRIYMLSRLYQSRKMVSQVLASWRRILDGEHDAGGELIDGEADLRRYLSKIRDKDLITDYGAWLARRNSKVGVQVFADESARVKFNPNEAVSILKEKAPGAVKDYLEYLVFGKNHIQYVNDLLSFYLSTVLDALSQPNSTAKTTLLESYETYRALEPPKSTYSDFITDNAVPEEWFANRLRLLQLIGGSHGAASRYDVHALRTRLEPYSDALVPEMIILNGREGKHAAALHLLVAGLGDYDTAVRYCLLGGSSIFHPRSSTTERPPLPSKNEQAQLFTHLLHEFLAIENVSARLERTAELLERFGAWFEVEEVLALIPSEWAVQVVGGFLISAVRRLVREGRESAVVKALASARNLRTSVAVAEKIEGLGPVIVDVEDGGEIDAS